MLREKIGLKKIKNPKINFSKSFYNEINNLLNKSFKSTKKISTFFEKNFENDLWFHYFGADIFYDGFNDKKNVDDFKYVNIFKKLSKNEKKQFQNRIVFFKIQK